MTAPAVLSLTLSEFRTFEQATATVDAPAVVLIGPNGAGKTNLLEALSFLSPGRGLRRATASEPGRRAVGEEDAPPRAWAVRARLRPALESGEAEAAVGTDPQRPERKIIRIDGVTQRSQTALSDLLRVAWVTPPMDRLFQEGASPRRRFLDRLAFSFEPGHAARLAGYEQAMKERLRLLKDGVRDRVWLAALEERMASDGAAVAGTRRRWCAQLSAATAAGVGPFPAARLQMAGDGAAVWCEAADSDPIGAAERLRDALALARRVDAAAGTTSVGPHRADLAAIHGVTGVPADRCSTGEQKALLLALVLAQARLLRVERGAPPLMLLDEATAHLDESRRAGLFTELLALGGQIWATGTDRVMFAALEGRATFFSVEAGRITPLTSISPPGQGGAES